MKNSASKLRRWARGLSAAGHQTKLYELAKELDLFHKGWYERRHGLRFETKREAFDHYLRVSKFSNVSPCPKFDGEMYLRINSDCLESGVSPLEHYLTFGHKEKRIVRPVTERWIPRDALQLADTLSMEAGKLRVAVCLHIYYPDYVARFKSALAHFPLPFDLFVACGGDVSAQAAESFKFLPNCRNFESKACPNRGRNFGPMLVEFSRKLLRYDLLIHLHSKKSLYSGKERHQWSDYLAEYLLRDTAVVGRALNAFASDPGIGVYYPTPYWVMPAWVNHWTRNKSQCEAIFAKTGPVETTEDFLAYPVGGMFWARPSAIAPLLAHDYRYEDFPAEPVPPDGTSLHALERIIGLLAEREGYSQLFFYPPRGTFTRDRTYIFTPYTASSTWLHQQLSGCRVISFDLFDTLVRRRYHAPDYAKLKAGQKLAAEGLVGNAAEYVRLRNDTEAALRRDRRYAGDVKLIDIARAIAAELGLRQGLAHKFAELEFWEDYEMIAPKNEMVDIYNSLASNHTLWIVTDTYYDRRQIGLILRKAGLRPPADLFISSELQLRKDNGTMWRHIKNILAQSSESSYIHVGDNVVSDAQRAGDAGLRTCHILNPLDKWQALGHSPVLAGNSSLDEAQILKWGPLLSSLGRSPFLME